MTLRLYNTLSRTKEDFVPLDPANVRMYVCGPTVYDYAHIGNARPAIVFDVLFRLLRHIYGPDHVTYVRNITDIDDKINARALELKGERNIPILEIVRELTVGTAKIYEDDMAALGCLPPTHSPRATRHIPQMIAMIQALIEAGHAYAADGHVLFDVSSKADYGKLARRSVDDMVAGARVDPAPYKKSPMDFVLWKPSDAQTPGWESPWGFGRPGWHLECSAMSAEYLGETFDIHGGGIDLVFPHHENEIAQSEGAHHDHPIARYWMHNGHLNVEGAKMSKSLGNFVTVHELLTEEKFGGRSWAGSVLRTAMLMTHYTQPLDWTVERLEEAQSKVISWFVRTHDLQPSGSAPATVIEALSEDLNTHKAFGTMDAFLKAGRQDESARQQLRDAMELLGISPEPERFEKFKILAQPAGTGDALRERFLNEKSLTVATLNGLIQERAAAKKARNFAESDRIRDELLAKGIVLKDGPTGTTWEVKR